MSKLSRIFLVFLGLGLVLVLLSLFSLSIGDSRSSLWDVLDALLGRAAPSVRFIILRARLPRILVSLLAGASLAQSGVLLQTLTRNPLADSGILGINTGAGFAVALIIAAYSITSPGVLRYLPLLAVLGGCVTIGLVYLLARRPPGQALSPVRLIISGVAVTTMLSGLMVAVMSNIDRFKVAHVVTWLSGSFSGDDWPSIGLLTPFLLLVWLLVYSRSQALNILLLNDQTAQGLGLSVQRERLVTLFLSTILAALSVILAGNITFIGLVAGHIGRRLLGSDHRLLLPGAALAGAILLLTADTVIRVLMVGTGIPTGLMVSILGAPYFLWLLRQQ